MPCFTMYNVHLHFGPSFQGEKSFNFLIQLFIYLYLETKLIIIFWGIILHTDIIAF